MRNIAPQLQYFQPFEGSLSGDMGIAIEGSNASVPGDDRFHANSGNSLTFPSMNPYSPSRFFEIFAQGIRGFGFDITTDPFVRLSQTSGTVTPDNNGTDIRIWLSIDWKAAPSGSGVAHINITSSTGYGTQFSSPQLLLPYNNAQIPSSFTKGFVESNGVVSIEAEHHNRITLGSTTLEYMTIPNYGKTLSGATLTDSNAPSLSFITGPSLEYDFYTFTNATARPSDISLILGQSLNTNPQRPLKYAIAIDSIPPKTVQYVVEKSKSAKQSEWPGGMPHGWENAVTDSAWVSTASFPIGPGKHTLKFWALEPGVILQKIVVDLGGVRKSYLGPPESLRVGSVFL
jgi:hypothetical protein